MNPPSDWVASIEVRAESPAAALRLYRVLLPEASREVPRTRVTITAPEEDRLTLEITARDTGALRAALQTYLGWIQLTDATSVVARAAPDGPSSLPT